MSLLPNTIEIKIKVLDDIFVPIETSDHANISPLTYITQIIKQNVLCVQQEHMFL